MKKIIIIGISLVVFGSVVIGWDLIRGAGAQLSDMIYDNPDLPSFLNSTISKEEYMLLRAEGIAMKRGVHKGEPFDPKLRVEGVKLMKSKESDRLNMPVSPERNSLLAPWTSIGPAPIPNGSVAAGASTPASGRTLSIAVHPTNPDIVYAGTAQGGLYRSLNGGSTWTPLMDDALSLAIGAVTIAPSQPDTVYVGTGEAGFCGDCFFGVGVYRIDNASSASPVLTGPLNRDGSDIDIFTGRSIGEIAVHPTDPATIFVATASGNGGIGGVPNNILPARGIYRSTNATAASPTFTRMTGLNGNTNNNVRDIAIDPLNPNLLVANVVFAVNPASTVSGIYVSSDALAASPVFTQRVVFNDIGTSELTAEFAIQHTPGSEPVIYAATGNLGGRVLRSTDSGTTWTQQIDNNFCSPQCFYDIAVAVDPNNAANLYLGGSPNLAFGRSADSGLSFTTNAVTSQGLHVDSHVIAISPSNPLVAYFGSDGGIYRTNDVSATPIIWIPLNNSTYSATQFMSLAVHPTDPNFTIGGTQDNGTNFYSSIGSWLRVDGGDGGFSAIDTNASDTTNVRMYHLYFTRADSQVGYATRGTISSSWIRRGCFGSTPANGIGCDPRILFYAPFEPGPGNPNTVYFGSDRLYRSEDTGQTHTVVSQAPIQFNVAISAIGISPQNDNVRIVGQTNGNIVGTTDGSSTLTNLDPFGNVPNSYVARAVVDPQNAGIAYVTLSAFGISNVWRTTNLSGASTTWTAASNGLPQVPVSSFIVDPANSAILYAGTDIGVFVSSDSGENWAPFGTGLPRVAVFDMAKAPGNMIRIATHGRGMWQIPAFVRAAPLVLISGRVTTPGGLGLRNATVSLTDSTGVTRIATTSSFGVFRFDNVASEQNYEIGVTSKRFRFATRQVAVNGNLADVDFIGLE